MLVKRLRTSTSGVKDQTGMEVEVSLTQPQLASNICKKVEATNVPKFKIEKMVKISNEQIVTVSPVNSSFKDASPNKLESEILKDLKESTPQELTPLHDPNYFLRSSEMYVERGNYATSSTGDTCFNTMLTRNRAQSQALNHR